MWDGGYHRRGESRFHGSHSTLAARPYPYSFSLILERIVLSGTYEIREGQCVETRTDPEKTMTFPTKPDSTSGNALRELARIAGAGRPWLEAHASVVQRVLQTTGFPSVADALNAARGDTAP